MKRKLIGLILIMLPYLCFAEKLPRPPDEIIGIGASPCAEFVQIYDAMQRIKQNKESDYGFIAGTFGAYGDFTGTLGGFLSSSMMENGDRKIPFENDDDALSKIYVVCKANLKLRFIDVVYIVSHTAFGRAAFQ